MSCVRCDKCEQIIDSDDDPDCFVNVEGFDQSLIACESCRGHMEESGELDVESNTLVISKSGTSTEGGAR